MDGFLEPKRHTPMINSDDDDDIYQFYTIRNFLPCYSGKWPGGSITHWFWVHLKSNLAIILLREKKTSLLSGKFDQTLAFQETHVEP